MKSREMGIHLVASFILLFFIFNHSSSSPPSIYDALTSNGLPIGILPKGITNFTIDPSTQRFQVQLNTSCHTQFETSLRFHWNISGFLSYGEISNLSGIAAQDLFLWFPVKGIYVDVPTSGIIYFDVGVVFKRFSLSSFEVPRDCTRLDDVDAELTDYSRLIQGRREKIMMQHGEGEGNEQRAIA